MSFLTTDHDEEAEAFRIAPMVDIVFILLAFFVLASEFRLPERDFDMGYDPAVSGAGALREDLPERVPVELRNSDGRTAITIGQARLPDDDFDSIRAKLADINLPDLPVAVLADPTLTVDQVARAVDSVLASPMKKVSIAKLTGLRHDE